MRLREQKKAPHFCEAKVLGDDLLSHLYKAVPLARSGLTSLFGMGRGVPRRYYHRNLSILNRMYDIDKSLEEKGVGIRLARTLNGTDKPCSTIYGAGVNPALTSITASIG